MGTGGPLQIHQIQGDPRRLRWCFDNNADGSITYNSTFKCAGKIVSWVARGDYVVNAKCWHQGGVIIPVTKDN